MGKDNLASAMEIDDPKSNTSDQTTPKFSINVLQLLKSAQMQHGLRHGDYTRYRRYCTARLRRLYKSLKFTHGRGKYSKRPITESTVTEVRFLHLVLYTAERAWSHAMEKRQLPDGPNARQRIYLIDRLRKAVKWATLVSQLCAVKGDSRTSLEAEAYASFMKGNLLFEQDKNCDTALMNFKSARAVYEELGKYGDLENQVLCRERVEELEPSIRYCLHTIGKSNLQASDLLQIGEMEGPSLDLFKAKLEAVMAEARSQQAASMTEFHWLGHRFPISNAKTRVSILKGSSTWFVSSPKSLIVGCEMQCICQISAQIDVVEVVPAQILPLPTVLHLHVLLQWENLCRNNFNNINRINREQWENMCTNNINRINGEEALLHLMFACPI
nr:signal recognition particle subunit SRP68-like isoform X2 [Ziziphus jujuba var. spinosa]